METIRYNVTVPELTGKPEGQRCRDIEDYMRESNRQIRLLTEQLAALRAAIRADQQAGDKETAGKAATAREAAKAAMAAAEAAQETADAATEDAAAAQGTADDAVTAAANARDAADSAMDAAEAAQATADAAATPADVAAAVAESEGRRADYVTEQGAAGDWQYRKWQSGLVECWANSLTVTLGAANSWTSELVYMNGSVTFPFAMASELTTNVTAQVVNRPNTTEINGLLLIALKSTTGFTIRFVRKTGASAVRLDIYVRGYLADAQH